MTKKITELEEAKVDMENKWIQERLKHHQTTGDMQKANEKLQEAEKGFDEEMKAHRATIEKYESLKKKFTEKEKKAINYKKTIKNLSQQILDLHNSINKGGRGHNQLEPIEEMSPDPSNRTWEGQEDEVREDDTGKIPL